MISIIMPAFNAAHYIREAIDSVLAQDHTDWELIVVNDGSTDDTPNILAGYADPRIKIIHQTNQGIGAARNSALAVMRGAYLATLDADDVLPPRSLSSRLDVLLADPELSFADGSVITMDGNLENVIRAYTPSFTGEPFHELLLLTGRCFFGATWLIRLQPNMHFRYDTIMSHAEDLLFYLELAPGRRYAFTTEVVLLYRRTGHSAMNDLNGLARGYAHVGRWINERRPSIPAGIRRKFAWRCSMILVRSYIRNGEAHKALRQFLIFMRYALFKS